MKRYGIDKRGGMSNCEQKKRIKKDKEKKRIKKDREKKRNKERESDKINKNKEKQTKINRQNSVSVDMLSDKAEKELGKNGI